MCSGAAKRLGFSVREWELMEEDERMVPDPDDFWDRAMELVGELDARARGLGQRRGAQLMASCRGRSSRK
jgi:hypothetical protein